MVSLESPLKLGVIGFAGSQGAKLIFELLRIEEVEVVAVADPAPHAGSMARRIGVTYDQDSPDSAGFRKLLGRADIDAVVVAVPTPLHYAVASDALRAGKHLFLEKPICLTIDQGKQLVALAGERQLVLAVGHVERHNPAFGYAQRQLRELGAPLKAEAYRVGPDPERIKDSIILDIGIHEFDLLPHLLEQPVRKILTRAGHHTHAAEDYATVRLTFANEKHADVHLDWFHRAGPERRTVVTCERGVLTLDYRNQSVTVSTGDHQESEERTKQFRGSPIHAEMRDFIDAVSKRRQPAVSAEEALQALQIALAAMKSARTGNEEEPEE